MYLVVVFLPLITSIICLLLGKYIGRSGASFITVIGILLCLIFSFTIFYEVGLSKVTIKISAFSWLNFLNIDICLFFDGLVCSMLFIILFISFFVHLYSIEYMKKDQGYIRYMSYLSLFTFFMIFLVTSDNYLQMFFGWEGVGLSSYLLISFWYTRILANKAGIKAMLVNKIGDLSLLISICMIFIFFGTLKYNLIFSLVDYVNNFKYEFFFLKWNFLELICFFLFIGAMGKSAQIGLHIWLPDAMEGPTPVSALIHAATMVTAGVFLIIRSCFLYEYSSNMLVFVAIVGALTALFSSIIGVFQFDVKKIVAYSTCSQLGYMFFSCGLSNYNVGLFHLFNHAFFKALLFLSMGSIIHAIVDDQDIRKMGNLVFFLPLTYICVFIGSLSLLAMPFLTGFYSKDLLLELSYANYTINGVYVYMLGIFAAFFTSFYSIRLIFWVFFSEFNEFKMHLRYIHEPKFFMSISIIFLSIFSIFVGFVFCDIFTGFGSLFLNNFIYFKVSNYNVFDSEFDLFFVKFVPLFISLLGIFSFIFLNKWYTDLFFEKLKFKFIYLFFNKAMLYDNFYNFLFKKLLNFSYSDIYKIMEKGFFELIMFNIIVKIIYEISNRLYNFNSGLIYHYIFNMIFIIVGFIILIEFINQYNLSLILFLLINIFI